MIEIKSTLVQTNVSASYTKIHWNVSLFIIRFFLIWAYFCVCSKYCVKFEFEEIM